MLSLIQHNRKTFGKTRQYQRASIENFILYPAGTGPTGHRHMVCKMVFSDQLFDRATVIPVTHENEFELAAFSGQRSHGLDKKQLTFLFT